MTDTDFTPRWASPPGDTIKDALHEQKVDRQALAEALEMGSADLHSLLDGSLPLTIKLAERLSTAIGGTVEFWMTRDGQYRADRTRVEADAWAQQLPLPDMTAFGWIEPDIDWIAQIDECFRFFDVTSLRDWETSHATLVAKTLFRSSRALETDEFAVAAWLRQCEIELSQVACGAWDRDAFAALLPELLPLTRVADPQRFLPELQQMCAEVGVAVGVVRAPRNCAVSGAARRLDNGHLSIALTGRHRADDHLWFTFFHEAAHLVLHNPDVLYVDEIDLDSDIATSDEEAEADRFAATTLVPPEFMAPLASARRSPLELRRIARQIGVSTGIVIGYLQHEGVLGYRTKLNRLKNRYAWNGPNLERA